MKNTYNKEHSTSSMRGLYYVECWLKNVTQCIQQRKLGQETLTSSDLNVVNVSFLVPHLDVVTL